MSTSERKDLDIGAIDIGYSHLIEANAGTGKTYAIANLFLRFTLKGYDVQSMLVVTFTNAATDELRGRLRKRLVDAHRMFKAGFVDENEDDFFKSLLSLYPEGHDRKIALLHLELALLSMNEAAIHSIHGFCQKALTEQAFSSGQSFESEQADDEMIKQQVIRDWWRRRTYLMPREELGWYLENVFKNIEHCTAVINPLLEPSPPEIMAEPGAMQHGVDELCQKGNHILTMLIQLWESDHERIYSRLMDKDTYKLKAQAAVYKEKGLSDFFSYMDSLKDNGATTFSILKTPFEPYGFETLTSKLKKDGDPKDFDIDFFRKIDELTLILASLKKTYQIIEVSQASKDIRSQLSEFKIDRGLLSFNDMIERLNQALQPEAPAAERLAAILAQRFPIIMVDEFQDTDSSQYGIFQRIHKVGEKHTLIQIGDPKQAIYGFRGGDIFTYLRAKRETQKHWSLSTNWRSTEFMIAAINQLFEHENTFTFKDIPYHPSTSPGAGKCKAQPLFTGGIEQPALVIQQIPLGANGKSMNKNTVYDHVHQAVAEQISILLGKGQTSIGSDPKEKLKPGDIAVLVREKKEANALQQKLLEYGIRAVSISSEKIWVTNEAKSLLLLLEACILPKDRNLARQAMAAPLLGLGTRDIHSIQTNQHLWSNWIELLLDVQHQWQQKGFMPAFMHLLKRLDQFTSQLDSGEKGVSGTWLERNSNPDRALTNLMHLAELLQQASREHTGMEALLAWMSQQKIAGENEEHLLRLESDENLVKMTTLHVSKGLQFPVVFAPYLWHCKLSDFSPPRQPKPPLTWHEPEGEYFQYRYLPQSEKNHPAYPVSEHERLAEDVRLAYVALTRAESYCHVFFGPAGNKDGNAGQTALAWLLSEKTTDLDKQAFSSGSTDWSFNAITMPGKLEILSPHEPSEPEAHPVANQPITTDLSADRIDRSIRTDWRIVSFSSLTRGIHQSTRSTTRVTGENYALQYAAGAHVGNFLHALLESIQPDLPLQKQLERLVPYLVLKHNQNPKPDIGKLEGWLNNILHTPLDATGLTLATIPGDRRIPELEFDFSTNGVNQKALDKVLQQAAGIELPPLPTGYFRGMVTGSIDLAFEHDGRYYIADYKSNLLGRQLDDYHPDNLSKQILARRYDLQYLLYTLALHRHLQARLPGYEYERDFGGAYYLFLRGMTPETGASRGVFFNKPSTELIKTLDEQIFAIPEAQAS